MIYSKTQIVVKTIVALGGQSMVATGEARGRIQPTRSVQRRLAKSKNSEYWWISVGLHSGWLLERLQ